MKVETGVGKEFLWGWPMAHTRRVPRRESPPPTPLRPRTRWVLACRYPGPMRLECFCDLMPVKADVGAGAGGTSGQLFIKHTTGDMNVRPNA